MGVGLGLQSQAEAWLQPAPRPGSPGDVSPSFGPGPACCYAHSHPARIHILPCGTANSFGRWAKAGCLSESERDIPGNGLVAHLTELYLNVGHWAKEMSDAQGRRLDF